MNEQLASFIGETIIDNWLSIISLIFTFCAGLVALTWFISNLIHKREIRLLEIQLTHQKDQFSQYQTIVNQRVEALKEQAGLIEIPVENKENEIPNVTNRSSIMYSKELQSPEGSISSVSTFLKNTEALSSLLSSIMRFM